METELKRGIPYMPWRTLLTALDILADAGLPAEVDRSVFRTFSGATQAELLTGMRSCGLLDDAGHPTQLLEQLVERKGDERKPLIKEMLDETYRDLLTQNDLTKTTSAMLNDRIEKIYAVSGSTKKKAVRFLLSGAEYVGIPVSPLLASRRSNGGGAPRKRRTTATSRVRSNADAPDATQQPAPSGSAIKQIRLQSGGTLSVSAAYNPFDLNEADRTFIDSLIKLLQNYESAMSASDQETR